MPMQQRKKILILEKDDFLREILGNLLHKKGGYIFSAFSLKDGLHDAHGHKLDTIILGTSCSEYKGKETLAYINKQIDGANPDFFIINDTGTKLDFVAPENQIATENLSVQTILEKIPV
ncbi:response regulator [Patescibacteria group bacterium]|nr:response regulator [Patescibacteria group bacterium]